MSNSPSAPRIGNWKSRSTDNPTGSTASDCQPRLHMRPGSDRGSRMATAAKYAIAPGGRDRIDPCLPGCRVPSPKFVSPRLNQNTGWVTYSCEPHCAGPTQRGTRARLFAALGHYGTLGVLEGLFAARCH